MVSLRPCSQLGLFACALLVCAAFGVSAAAAQSVGTSLSVPPTASVEPPEPGTGGGGLAPGAVTTNPGDPVTVQPADGAQMKFTFNAETTVSLPASVPLVGPGGTELPVSLLCAQATTQNHGSPSNFTCASGYNADPAQGTERWLYVGLEIAAGASENIPAGVYTAEVVVTFAF